MPIKQILLGDQILHGSDRAGDWVVEKLTGWYELPETRGEEEPRPRADGDYDSERVYSARMVTIDGILFHKGRGLLVEAMERLAVAAPLGKRDLVVTDAGMTRRLVVKALGVDFPTVSSQASRFQIRLRADDARKFGEARRVSTAVGTSVAVFHRGTYLATPIATITGSFPGGYALNLNGDYMQVTKSLSTGATHTVDMRTGILRENGAVVRNGFGAGGLLKVRPGAPQAMSSAALAGGDGTVRLDFYDTYM